VDRRAMERFQAAARVLDCAIYEMTANEDVHWTDGVTTAFGFAPEDVGSTRAWWVGRVHPEDRATVELESAASEAERRDGNVEFRWLAADGAYRDVWDRWITV